MAIANRNPPWETFPPRDERTRIENYEFNKMLLTGNHKAAFFRAINHQSTSEVSKVVNASLRAREQQEANYVVLNYCKTVATTFASKMFGTAPKFTIAEDGDPRQMRLEQIIRDNTLDNTNIEQAIASVSGGDCVYRVRYGQQRNWREPMPIIEAIPSKNFFVVLPQDSLRDNATAIIAFEVMDGPQKYLKIERHEPYYITHELWAMEGERVSEMADFRTIPVFADLVKSTELANIDFDGNAIVEFTNYPGLFVEYVPNFVLPDEYYGRSDYENLASIQRDINETNTGILQVLLKHIDPKLILPPGTMQYNEKAGTWYVLKEDLEVVEVDEEVGAVLPRYLVWDAQLSAAKANSEALFEAFMILADINLSILGITKYGTAESGSALELKMTQTTDAVNRKRMYFDTALKNILYAAQFVDHEYGNNPYEALEVNIEWASPVPLDSSTKTLLLTQQVAARIKSQHAAVSELQSLEGAALQEELDRINDDTATQATVYSYYTAPGETEVNADDDGTANTGV